MKSYSFVIIVLMLLISCKSDLSKKLIGKWHLTNAEIDCNSHDKHVVVVNGIEVKSGEEMFQSENEGYKSENLKLEFYPDNKYFLSNVWGASTGLYKVVGDSLFLTEDNGSEYGRFKIKIFSENKFELMFQSCTSHTCIHQEFLDRVND